MTKFTGLLNNKPSTFKFDVKITFDKPSTAGHETFELIADSKITLTSQAKSEKEAKSNISKILDSHKLKYEFINE